MHRSRNLQSQSRLYIQHHGYLIQSRCSASDGRKNTRQICGKQPLLRRRHAIARRLTENVSKYVYSRVGRCCPAPRVRAVSWRWLGMAARGGHAAFPGPCGSCSVMTCKPGGHKELVRLLTSTEKVVYAGTTAGVGVMPSQGYESDARGGIE